MNKADFQQILNTADKPLVVDFWAPWCRPCNITKPILEKLGGEFAGQVDFLPVNADDARELLEQYRILGIPTVIVFQNGKETARVVGAQNEEGYRNIFASLANGTKISLPMSQFDRTLRLGAGAFLVMYGVSNGNWLLVGIGAVIAFLGVYDRCPIWNGLMKRLRRE